MPNSKIQLYKGDITKLRIDAIVNAANNRLIPGGGVDGAIHRAAGPELEKECEALGGCATGEAKLAHGHKLPAKYVILTVGPVWQQGKKEEAKYLASCYQQSLQLAIKHHIKTIAFPAIGCGIYGYPILEAAEIAVKTANEFLNTHTAIDKVIFVCFDDKIYQAYQHAIDST